MSLEYIANDSDFSWTDFYSKGKHAGRFKTLLRCGANGPEASHSERWSAHQPAHFHPAAQFQLATRGWARYPTYEIQAVSLRYTDHNVPYGPFETSPDYHHYVLHAKPGAQVVMTDPRARKHVNRGGREIIVSEEDVEWLPVEGSPGARRKVLIEEPSGVRAEILELPSGTEAPVQKAEFGRYELVLKGSVRAGDSKILTDGLRFVIGDDASKPLVGGPEGAVVVLMQYDRDADRSYVGLFAGPDSSGEHD